MYDNTHSLTAIALPWSRAPVDPELIQGTLGMRQEYTLDGTRIHRKEPCMLTHIQNLHKSRGNLSRPVQLLACFLVGGRKLENPYETHVEKMHRNSAQTVTRV